MANLLRSEKSQALVELAIFGAILLMLLGIVLSYGLKSSIQQKVMMNAFRGALKEGAVNGGQGSYLIIEDDHIPSPGNQFGMGSVMPFSANSNVIRSAALHVTADTVAELPRTAIDIKGSKCPGSYLSPAGSDPPCHYLSAGFSTINFGVPGSSVPLAVQKLGVIFGQNNVWETTTPGLFQFIDSCEGEIMDYNACKRQCRMITRKEPPPFSSHFCE